MKLGKAATPPVTFYAHPRATAFVYEPIVDEPYTRAQRPSRPYLPCEGYIFTSADSYLLCKGYFNEKTTGISVAISTLIPVVSVYGYPLQNR